MSLLSRTHDLVGPERGSCSACYTSNATFREDGVGSKQDMADRVGGRGGASGGGHGRRPPV